MSFEYKIKAIPTNYGGVNFRSRLEAKWAAFFDIIGVHWEYEPFDLEGWAPDFLLRKDGYSAVAEVKPVTWETSDITASFDKAIAHCDHYEVMLLGATILSAEMYAILLVGGDHDPTSPISRSLVPSEAFNAENGEFIPIERAWRDAGNMTQWQPEEATLPPLIDVSALIKTAEKYRAMNLAEKAAA